MALFATVFIDMFAPATKTEMCVSFFYIVSVGVRVCSSFIRREILCDVLLFV